MQRTNIEWCTHVWNPIKGCLGGCEYCYAKKIATRFPKNFPKDFKPTFYPEELDAPYKLKKRDNVRIFADSISDFFGYGVDPKWQDSMLNVIRGNPDLTFIILTKQPQRIEKVYEFPKNLWLGVSIDYPSNFDKIDIFRANTQHHSGVKFISFEPLMGLPKEPFTLKGIDWVIIGAQTNPTRCPENEWVSRILDEAKERKIPVFMKDNLIDRWTMYLPELREGLREYPKVIK